jgi:hypothetical protein
MRKYSAWPVLLTLTHAACASAPDGAAPTGSSEQGWDSQGGNPTHATHSYLTEFALDQLRGTYPELDTYRQTVVDASNVEIHDIALDDAFSESLRHTIGGNNWGCAHPEYLWSSARHFYTQGDKRSAYWYLGLLLHYVEDAGVPAHAFHVYHQSSLGESDNFEVQAFQQWMPSFASIDRANPTFATPTDYVALSASWAAHDFNATFPGVTYTRTFFSPSALLRSDTERSFMGNRQGRTATAVKWALHSAMSHWGT